MTVEEIENLKRLDKSKKKALKNACEVMIQHSQRCIAEDDEEISLLQAHKLQMSIVIKDMNALVDSRHHALMEKKKFDTSMVDKWTKMVSIMEGTSHG
jgi:hypothetical protein